MNYILKRKNEFNTSNWCGGSTTELFIFPKDASYAARNFEIRVSSATVELSPSMFTLLPLYKRVLMPISASLKLVFEKENNGQSDNTMASNNNELLYPDIMPTHREKTVNLEPLESVKFEGGWKTVSHGICVDIGIMHSPLWRAELISKFDNTYKCTDDFICFYALSDGVKISTDSEIITLMKNDFLVFENKKSEEISFIMPKQKTVIIARFSKI